MKIIITRHGETLENIEGRFMGHNHGTLSEKGKEQAKKLAEELSKQKIDVILSSDLNRAADTAKEIFKYHTNIPIKFIKELRERNLGELGGMLKKELGLDPKQLVAGTIESKQGETQLQMFQRAKELIRKILREHKDKTILMVGHNGMNMALMANILGRPFEEYDLVEKQDNCGISIFELKGDKFEITVSNYTGHLQ